MRKKFIITSSLITLVLFISGLTMIFKSTDLGQSKGFSAMQANGGSMDTQRYYGIINSTSENYRSAGAIISLVGGLGMILSGIGLYKEI